MSGLAATASRAAFALGIFFLSMLVVISTPQTAHAFDVAKPKPYLKVTPKSAFKFGVTKPGPVGWAITAGALGWMAYENRDQIVQWFGGDPDALDEYFGGAIETDGMGERTTWGPSGNDGQLAALVVSVTGNKAVIEVTCLVYTGSTCKNISGLSYVYHYSNTEAICRPVGGGSDVVRNGPNGNTGIRTKQVTLIEITLCQASEQLVGFAIGPNSNSFAQKFGIAWGESDYRTVLDGSEIGIKQFDVTVWCQNVETQAVQTITHTSPGTDPDNVVVPSCKQRLGDDWVMTKVRIQPVIDPDTLPEDVPLWDVPDFPPFEWDEEIPDEVQQPCEKSKNGCSLSVWIDDTPCDIDVPICKKWTTVLTKNPSRVECYWGQRQVNVKWCMPLEYAYDSGTETKIDKGTKPAPQPEPDTPVKEHPDTEPVNPPKTTPGPPTTDPIPAPGSPGGETENCWEGMVSWNPVDWVYTPIKCALSWAFVPKTSFKERVTRLRTAFASKAPFSFFAGLGDLSTGVGGGSCPANWKVHFQGQDYPLLCGTAMGTAVRNARPFVTVLVLAAAAYPFVRALVYAAFPILKPTPTA